MLKGCSNSVRVARIVSVTAIAIAAAAAAGCGNTVAGVAEAGGAATSARPGLSKLLLEPEAFPTPYEAIVLPPQAVSMAAPDLTGVPAGAEAAPAECVPPTQNYGPTGTVMAVGTNNASRSTISVQLVRSDTPLADLAVQTERCPEVTVTASGAVSTVLTEITPAPPIRADDTLALRRTVKSGKGSDKVTQSMVTLIAQVDDVQVSATFMSFGDGEPDTTTLDELFTAAVAKVQAG